MARGSGGSDGGGGKARWLERSFLIRVIALVDAYQISVFSILMFLAYFSLFIPGIPYLKPTHKVIVFFTGLSGFAIAANLVFAWARDDEQALTDLLRVEAFRTIACALCASCAVLGVARAKEN